MPARLPRPGTEWAGYWTTGGRPLRASTPRCRCCCYCFDSLGCSSLHDSLLLCVQTNTRCAVAGLAPAPPPLLCLLWRTAVNEINFLTIAFIFISHYHPLGGEVPCYFKCVVAQKECFFQRIRGYEPGKSQRRHRPICCLARCRGTRMRTQQHQQRSRYHC